MRADQTLSKGRVFGQTTVVRGADSHRSGSISLSAALEMMGTVIDKHEKLRKNVSVGVP